MDKIIDILYDKILATLIKVIGLVMLFSILAQIFTRSFLRVPFAWTDEVARFAFLFFCFLGGVMTLRYKLHLGIDFFESKMPAKGRFINRIFVYGMVIAFGLFVGILGIQLIGVVGAQLTPIMRIPMRYIYLSLPVAGFLYAFLGFYQLYCHVRGRPYNLPVPKAPRDDSKSVPEVSEGKQ